jgi:hypothetical protein
MVHDLTPSPPPSFPLKDNPTSPLEPSEPSEGFPGKEVALWSTGIDWQMQGLENAFHTWQEGRVQEALLMVSDTVLKRLAEAGTYAHRRPPEKDPVSRADTLLKQGATLLQFGPVNLGSPINWFARIHEDQQWTAHLNYMYWINDFVDAYRETGDERYAKRWIEIIEDFLDHIPYGSPALSYNASRPSVLNHAKTCNNGESCDGQGSWMSLSCHWRIEAWLLGLYGLAGSQALTPAKFFRIADSMFGDHLHIMITNPRENTPNQFLAISSTMMRLGLALPEFKAANVAFQIGYHRLLRAIDNAMLPDGSDLEQSVNYNVHFCDAMTGTAESLYDHAPERAKVFQQAAQKRAKFIVGLMTPLGRTVSLAKTGIMPMAEKVCTWPEALDLPWIMHVMSGGRKGPLPPFTSVAFAYGGFYALRSGWNEDSDYLFFKTSRPGLGHMHEDCLSLHITSGGRDLIVDSGNYSYTKLTDLDEKMNAYSLSSASHSTVLVDGQGQARLPLRTQRPWTHEDVPLLRGCEQPRLPDRAVQGQWFEFVEGSYADGYGPEGIEAEHHRSVIWIKDLGWLIVDRLTSAVKREYTAVWTLAPEFSRSDTRVDQEWVRASQPKGSMTLIPVAHETPSIELYHGSDDPVAGWFSHSYGERKPKPDIHVNFPSTGNVTVLATLILPADISPKPIVRKPTEGGRIDFEIDLSELGHVNVSCADDEARGMRIDAQWTPPENKTHQLAVGTAEVMETAGESIVPLSPIYVPAND